MLETKNKKLRYFSLELLTMERLTALASPAITTGQIFESSNVFHRNGLFSTEIFGDIGSRERFRKNGHINLRLNILHPLAYIGITSMSSLHKGIIDGVKKAIWNPELKDFIESEDGETGLNFFMSRFNDIEFKNPNDSDLREFKIRLTEIHSASDLLMSKTAVISAGLRDYVVDRDGKPSQGEINDLYRSLINTSNMLPENYKDEGYYPFTDSIRNKLQQTMNEIYLYSMGIVIVGKKSLLKGHLMSKNILNGTRNVITADNSFIERIGHGNHLRFNELAVGLYQHCKAIEKITLFGLKQLFVNIFSPSERTATIINTKTFEEEKIPITTSILDLYTTNKGLASYLNKFSDSNFGKEVFGSDKYPFLMVKDTGTEIELVDNIAFINSEDYKYLRPVKNMEILFMSIVKVLDKFYATTTRYPAINQGNTYPVKPKIKPTVKMRSVTLTINGVSYEVSNYPDTTASVYDSMSPNQTKLARAGADYDGDTQNYAVFITREANLEIERILKGRAFYIGANNKLVYSAKTDILEYTIKAMHKAAKK